MLVYPVQQVTEVWSADQQALIQAGVLTKCLAKSLGHQPKALERCVFC